MVRIEKLKRGLLKRFELATWSRVARQKGQRFCRDFNALNVVLNWPIEICPHGDFIAVSDPPELGGCAISIVHPSRLRLYRDGVYRRLESLWSLYMANTVEVKEGDLVLDIGSNVGEFALFAETAFGARTVRVEPEPNEVECNRRNRRRSDSVVVQAAAWRELGVVDFFSHSEAADSSAIRPGAGLPVTTVQATTVDRLIAEHSGGQRVRLLKIEAEGAEPEVVEGLNDAAHLVDYISVDCGPERGLARENTAVAVMDLLRERGFRCAYYNHRRSVFLFSKDAR